MHRQLFDDSQTAKYRINLACPAKLGLVDIILSNGIETQLSAGRDIRTSLLQGLSQLDGMEDRCSGMCFAIESDSLVLTPLSCYWFAGRRHARLRLLLPVTRQSAQ